MKFNYIYTKWVLIGLIVIAGILRYFTLNTISLTLEEQLIWFAGIQNTPIESLLFIAKIKPFSLIIAITSWLSCFDGLYIELVNRAITIIAGIIAVPLGFILTRKFYSEIEGIIVAGFICLSWNCITASQNIVEYSFLLVFILLYFIALISFLDRISEEDSELSDKIIIPKQESIFLIVSGLLVGFISIWGIAVVFISFFYTFFFIKKRNVFLQTIGRFAYIIVPLGLFSWWGLYQNIIYTSNKYTATDYLNSISSVITNNYILSILIIMPLFYLIFVYIKRIISKDEFGEDAKTKFNNSTLVISIWLVASVLVFVLITSLLRIRFTIDDLIFILPPLFILVARSIVLISSKLKHQIIIASIFGLFFVISVFINLENIDNKPEYNLAVRYVMRVIKNDNKNKYAIMMSADKNNIFPKEALTYYLKKNEIKNEVFVAKNINNVIKKIKKEKKVNYIWFIADNDYTNKKIIAEMIKKGLIQSGYRYKGITIYKIGIISSK
jgi:hypothetical protein